jgi:hypothetical protein
MANIVPTPIIVLSLHSTASSGGVERKNEEGGINDFLALQTPVPARRADRGPNL